MSRYCIEIKVKTSTTVVLVLGWWYYAEDIQLALTQVLTPHSTKRFCSLESLFQDFTIKILLMAGEKAEFIILAIACHKIEDLPLTSVSEGQAFRQKNYSSLICDHNFQDVRKCWHNIAVMMMWCSQTRCLEHRSVFLLHPWCVSSSPHLLLTPGLSILAVLASH